MNNGHALHVYYGDGKGKTTAAMGLALRAAGQGLSVLVGQLLKTNTSGELASLRLLPGVCISLGEPVRKLTFRMTSDELADEKRRQRANFEKIRDEIRAKRPDLIVMDELLTAEHLGFVDAKDVMEAVREWLPFAEVALTGRWCCEEILTSADYATEMVKRRHPYDQGIAARRGIEY